MCGFAGFISAQEANSAETILTQMANSIAHRGPDDSGIWMDNAAGIGLAHRRLSIVDLSAAGHQPMISASGRYVMVFNGEIYNHNELRAELTQTQWRGHSDTETLLTGFDVWGVESTIKRAVGMFAFALWDKLERVLTLGRDRLGEKPLYYGWQGNAFLFGSELKSLKVHPSFNATIDRNSLALLMRHNAISTPYSIYEGIKKLFPGSLLTMSLQNRDAQPVRYWDACQVAVNGFNQPFRKSPQEAVIKLEELLRCAIKQQMMADVPLGAFLSGGVDSSTVVALMQTQSSQPVKTFSIGFNEESFNEAEHAKAVAQHLGTDHTELYVTSEQAIEVIPRLPFLYDEPFSDSSQIPTVLVSELAKQHVTVSLSGDGGDEVFGGYNRYVLAQQLWGKLSRIPTSLRKILVNSLLAISPNAWNRLSSPIQSLLPKKLRYSNIGDKLHKGAGVVTARDSVELYRLLVSHWPNPEELVLHSQEPSTALTENVYQEEINSFVHRMMLLDTIGYLPDDILVKVDRAAMGVSLESRVPLIDHRVVEFAWQLPLNYKLRGGVGKWPLRQVLYKYVPQKLIERPKMGFGVPIDSWLRGPLKDWAENLLDESHLRQEGYFNASLVRQKWSEHLSGQRNWQYQLWDVLMFQAWLSQESNI